MKFVFTLAVLGEGENELDAFSDALTELAGRILSHQRKPLDEEFVDVLIYAREVEEE